MKIYVVTSGVYSDYRICGMFTKKENAELLASKVYDDNDIEEWETDIPMDIKNKQYYFVRMKRDGETLEVHKDNFSGTKTTINYGFDNNSNMYLNCFAKDEIHAVKIANEKRTQLIAEDKWK